MVTPTSYSPFNIYNKSKKINLYKTIKNISLNTPSTTIGIIYEHFRTVEILSTRYLTIINIIDEMGDMLCVRIFNYKNIYENCFCDKDIVIIKNMNIKQDDKNKSNIEEYVKDDGSVAVIKRGIDDTFISKGAIKSEKIAKVLTYKYKDLYIKLNERFMNGFQIRQNTLIGYLTNSGLKKVGDIQENTFLDFKGLCININNKTLDGRSTIYSFVDKTQNRDVHSERYPDEYRNNKT
ncbi:hypothetical protein CDIK_0373 [Cucumispora dikerogammari]|nr:hypothetical protein CDIK_0373 [Cucumispora dikerogammari]